MYKKEEEALEYRIMYIPVAEETLGGTPIDKNTGLKIAPPPRPRDPAANPPMKPNKTKVLQFLSVNLISDWHIPY